MASLSRLPNEMIAETWRHVLEPDEIESFALVSKHIYAVGSPFIMEHNKLKREFSFFETGPNTRASAPEYLLKNVLLRPRVALYVTHLSIGRHQKGWQDSNDVGYDDNTYLNDLPKTGHGPYPDDEMGLFIKAIQKTSFIPRVEVEEWILFVWEGDEDKILALLLLFLPNLTTITLNNEALNSATFRNTIQRIALGGQQRFLTHLKTVCLQGDFSSDNDCLKSDCWLEVFYDLPLLHAIHVKSICIGRKVQIYIPGSSNITELTFVESPVHLRTMFEILGSIKALKKFSCIEPGTGFYLSDLDFNPFWMRAGLLAHAKHSLESLTITFSQTEGNLLGTLCDFTALRELETNIHLLIRETKFDNLKGLLPTSIEQLHLHIGSHRCCDSIPSLVKRFVREKSRRLHNLRALKLSWEAEMGVPQANKDLIETLKETCRHVEIELTVTAG